MSIAIKTRLHEGIYKSSGGGQTRTHYEWATGPRNLMAAVDTFAEHVASMSRSYGNVGCGGSWMEIDGVRIDGMDLDDLSQGDDKREFDRLYSCIQPKSRTQKCREFIEYVKSGAYKTDKIAAAKWLDEEMKREIEARGDDE